MRRRRHNQRGFSLLAVIIILAVLVGGLLAILHDAGAGMKQYSVARSRELVNGAMEFGLKEAMTALQRVDPAEIIRGSQNGLDGGGDWDIFFNWGRRSFVCGDVGPLCSPTTPARQMLYPPTGPNQNELTVRVGLRLGQRTQAPAGEDVNNSYGYVVEILIAVAKNGEAGVAGERAIYAVRVPSVVSHSN